MWCVVSLTSSIAVVVRNHANPFNVFLSIPFDCITADIQTAPCELWFCLISYPIVQLFKVAYTPLRY